MTESGVWSEAKVVRNVIRILKPAVQSPVDSNTGTHGPAGAGGRAQAGPAWPSCFSRCHCQLSSLLASIGQEQSHSRGPAMASRHSKEQGRVKLSEKARSW